MHPTVKKHIHSLKASSELENEEPLSALFQRAMVLQRAGSMDQALDQYKLFCKAAVQCEVDPAQYAEVHVNMGAIFLHKGDSEQAKYHFDEALKHREMATARVNLAVWNLQQATSSSSRSQGLEFLSVAQDHCERVVGLNDNPRTVETAKRLLADIEKMVGQANGGAGGP